MNNIYLKKIYTLLKKGEQFGKFSYWDYYNNKPFMYPCFELCLYMDYLGKYFHWKNYGQSANKATIKNLNWIIREIFKTTPEKFLLQYKTKTDYNRFKIAINSCIENQTKLY